jgi:GNAT superfamily N-acetyltransferase
VSEIIIRKGTPADIPATYALIQELAAYERAADQVKTSVESMLRDGFGEKKAFDLFVADLEGEVVGIALYFPYYSSWKGRCLYLDDLVVSERHRRKGIGEMLVAALVAEAKAVGAQRILWQVLNWNAPAIHFYEKLGATFDDEWINCKLLEQHIYGA